MAITERTRVRALLRECPGSRTVLERHGLMGCGGQEGPDESLAVFARAHGIDAATLVHELRSASGEDAAAPPPAEETESYRYYLRAAVLIGMLAGAALGAVNLTWIAVWGYTGLMPRWDWWPALIQAHGNAQLFGWTGLFVIGIALHSLPRMLQRPAPSSGRAAGIFGSILTGLLLGLVAQPLAAQPLFGALFVVSAFLQWAGVTLFAAYLVRIVGRPREAYHALILAGTVWFWLGASAHVGLAVLAGHSGDGIPPAPLNAAYLHAMTWGFLLSYVLAYSLRLLPAFTGMAPAASRPAWAALGLLVAGTALEVGARAAGAAALSFTAALLTAGGVGAALWALKLGSPALTEGDREAGWLVCFARAAYTSLVLATVILVGLRAAEAFGSVPPLRHHAFGGASRHALTVGFISLMMVGVAWRILPIFSGAARPHPALLPAVFGLLVTGNLLRVGGQMASSLWGGGWYGVMGISGWLETLGVALFALDVLRLLSGTPAHTPLPEVDGPVEVALDAPVGPLVAHRPWLVPVFARHGLGQVTNPLFQRTVGRRVTVAQACRRFQLEAEKFLSELSAADLAHAGPQK